MAKELTDMYSILYQKQYGDMYLPELKKQFPDVIGIQYAFKIRPEEGKHQYDWFYKTGSLVVQKSNGVNVKLLESTNVSIIIGTILDYERENRNMDNQIN